ncbi:MAG: 30S ribosomal protein S16 [Phycisphaerae bacterium]|nr:30S ribosomal protein S16 [Phycisphaerae bacterium]
MAVKLRLKRLGRTHKPFYRLNAIDSRSPRDGRVLEELGHYDPANRVAEQQLELNAERIKYWLSVGALPTDTVRDLLKKNGITVK